MIVFGFVLGVLIGLILTAAFFIVLTASDTHHDDAYEADAVRRERDRWQQIREEQGW